MLSDISLFLANRRILARYMEYEYQKNYIKFQLFLLPIYTITFGLRVVLGLFEFVDAESLTDTMTTLVFIYQLYAFRYVWEVIQKKIDIR